MKTLHPLAQLRAQYGLTQQALADLLEPYPGFSKRTIEGWERGKPCPIKKLNFIANKLLTLTTQ